MKSVSSMYLALGYKCNHHCYFCPCGKKHGTEGADRGSILNAIEHGVSELNVEDITLSGGEPTIHPDFPFILKRCMELGAKVTVLTNGDRLCDLDFARSCFEYADPARVSVVSAIHSIDPLLHDKVTNVSNSFKRTILGLKNVISMNIPVTVKQCVSAWNYRLLPDFVDFIFGEFGSRVSATICGMDFCGMTKDETAEVAVGYHEMGPYLEKMLDVVDELRQKFDAFPVFSVCDLPLCAVDPYYWRYFIKSSRRTIAQYSAPTVRNSDIRSSFDVAGECDTHFECCNECEVNEGCPGIWKTAYQYFGDKEASPVHS